MNLLKRFIARPCFQCGQKVLTQRLTRNFSTRSGRSILIRDMEKKDTSSVHKLLDSVKWPMEKAYFDCVYQTCKDGFVVAVTPEDQVIGCHGFLAHGNSLVNMGLWIVDNSYRQDQIGHQLYGEIARNMPPEVNVGTLIWPHFVDKIKEMYGLDVQKSYMTWYNYGTINPATLTPCVTEDFEVLPVSHVNMSDLLSYDAEIHKIPREIYMSNWIHHENSRTYVAVRKGIICGFAVLRSQGSCNQIAPLYADNKHIAKALIRNCAKHLQDKKVGFSSPLQNCSAIAFAEANNMMKSGKPLLMVYQKERIDIDTERVYAVSSNSFGNC